MATFKVEELRKIDQSSKDSVYGYLRRIQSTFPSDNVYYNIPSLVFYWCLLYFWTDFKIKREQLAKLLLKHRRRPSVADLVAERILPEDEEVIAELKNIAMSHTRMSSAVSDLAQRLPFDEETNGHIATTMMNHLNDTYDEIQLIITDISDDDNDQQQEYEQEEEETDQEIENID